MSVKLVGYAKTIERGRVGVFRDDRGFHHVGDIGSLREAPYALEMAARGDLAFQAQVEWEYATEEL